MFERVRGSVSVAIAVVCLICCSFFVCVDGAYAESGTYRGVNWDLTGGVLTIGNGDEQTFDYVENQLASDWPWYNSRASITSVKFNGVVHGNGDMGWMFGSCNKLTSIDLSNFDTSEVTDMSGMFYNCYSLKSLNVSHFNTSKVTSMSLMFYYCSKLTSLNLSSFDTSNVTKMGSMFYRCEKLRSLNLSHFNTAKVTSTSDMFHCCESLTSLNISNWDTHNVINMSGMFDSCNKLTSLDVSHFDTSNVTTMKNMFQGCSKLTSLDVSHFDTSKVTDMSRMFDFCAQLASLDVSYFDTSNVTNMHEMFNTCDNLTSLDVSNFDTSKVTDMVNMFYNCSGLASLDISSFDTSSVTYMYGMFEGCSSLYRIKLGGSFSFKGADIDTLSYQAILPTPSSSSTSGKWVRLDNANDQYTPEQLRDMYDGSTMSGVWIWDVCAPIAVFDSVDGSLKFYNGNTARTFEPMSTQAVYIGWDRANYTKDYNVPWHSNRSSIKSVDVVDEDIAPISTKYWFSSCSNMSRCNLQKLDTSNVTNMYQTFKNCSKLTLLDVSSWDTSNVTDMSEMFSGCSSLTSFDLSNFDTSNVTNMYGMFYRCSQLVSVDVNSWDTSKVTSMNSMFYNCSNLASLNISNWDTSNVMGMSSMFQGCSKLKSLNISHLNTAKVTDMSYMFFGCPQLTSLDLSSFDTSNVTDMYRMFYGCRGLKSLDLSDFDTSNLTSTNSMFYDCSNLTSLDLSGWDTGKVTSMYGMFYNCSNLNRVALSESFSFKGNNISYAYNYAILPTPPTPATSGKWILEDRSQSALTPTELRDTYDGSTMSGVWVWDAPSYKVSFDSNGGSGSMLSVSQPIASVYTVPSTSNFYRNGYKFAGWSLSPNGEAITFIAANTQTADTTVTLYALWEDATGFNKIGTGEFEFDLEAGSKMWFGNVPAGVTYKVYEETPSGWVLVNVNGESGAITPNQEAQAEFTNTYDTTKTSVVLSGKKFIDGRAADAGAYTFELYEGDTLVQSKSNSAGGTIMFDPITYKTSGVHTYSIREVAEGDNTIQYDTHTEEVTVTVQGVDGALSATVDYDDDGVVFNNTSKSGVLRIMKLIEGALASNQTDAFTVDVTLKDAQGNPVTEGVEANKADAK